MIIQDRTPEDVQIPGSKDHIRGYFFALFPRLTAMEIQRRRKSNGYVMLLKAAGFTGIISVTVWENTANL